MEKVYELMVLLHPDLELGLEAPLKKLNKIIADHGGKVVAEENWGKKRLAYPIKKQDFAVYVLFDVAAGSETSNKIQALLNITDEVLRYLMVEKDLTIADKKQASEARKVKREQKGVTDEADDKEEPKRFKQSREA